MANVNNNNNNNNNNNKYFNNFNMQFENKVFGIQGYLLLNYYTYILYCKICLILHYMYYFAKYYIL